MAVSSFQLPETKRAGHKAGSRKMFANELRLGQCGAGLGLERGFGDGNQLREGCAVLRGDVGENLAIQRAFGGLKTFHEAAIRKAGSADRGVNADLPQIAELAFFAAAVAIGVLAAVINGVRSVTVQFAALEAKALRGANHSRAAFA
jgi:hypothetical protein